MRILILQGLGAPDKPKKKKLSTQKLILHPPHTKKTQPNPHGFTPVFFLLVEDLVGHPWKKNHLSLMKYSALETR
jgi:hypothetical protein